MRLHYTFPLVIFFIIAALLWRGLNGQPSLIPSPLINKPAPAFNLPTLQDSNKWMSQQDFLGHITLFNVWATWCATCTAEHENLIALSKLSNFILIGLDYKDDRDTAIQWLTTHGNPYTEIAFDADGQASIDWGVYGTPETFVIDKKGMIRDKIVGPITTQNWEQELKPLIEKLQMES